MSTEAEIKHALRVWVVEKSGKFRPEQLDYDTPIIEQRIITSLQVMDLILFLEQLTGDRIDVERLKVGVFRDINTIYRNFCEGARDVN